MCPGPPGPDRVHATREPGWCETVAPWAGRASDGRDKRKPGDRRLVRGGRRDRPRVLLRDRRRVLLQAGRNGLPWLSVCDLWERGHGPATPRTRWAPVQPGEPWAAPGKPGPRLSC